MTAEHDPQIGDVFRWASCQGNWHTLVRTVVAIDDTFVYWRADAKSGSVPVARWSDRATIIPPRPKVVDSWGYYCLSGFFTMSGGEATARATCRRSLYLTLARIVNGQVCDEHGVPFEVAS